MKADIIEWLSEAYRVERQLKLIFQRQLGNQAFKTGQRFVIETHDREIDRHLQMAATMMKSLGSEVSQILPARSAIDGFIQCFDAKLNEGEPWKDLMASYTIEHFVIGTYKAIQSAGAETGLKQVVDLCGEILVSLNRLANETEGLIAVMAAGQAARMPGQPSVRS